MTDDLPASVHGLLRLGSAAFAVLLALVVASAVTAPVSSLAIRAGIVVEGGNGWQLLRTVLQFSGFLLAALGYLAITEEWDLLRISRLTARDVGLVVGAGAALLVLQYAALFGLQSVGLGTAQNQATVPGGDPVAYYLAMIAVSLLVVGPVEELLFRGVVQGGLRRALDAAPAILLASVLFGLIHLPGIDGSTAEQWAYVGVVVGLGCVLGALYERTDNVLIPGLAHGVYNAAIYVVLLVNSI
ncbi:membrane protease YdiL (CAAX protease family) [Halorubrum alkaliphilum]|uniref:Membrane protease YdiL (CAAX protease family) n=1 Tax=Halorubrum alkaliphilum TaxID=261290 RepID=A0A8T4GG14_9EURY|nr:CPBP family intramembrane glutamic endopeptidase [Halorubrum alkaliphilum]MBP1922667.1 membrane protease YdiL (CAAX protease family) [Halorubrum alkaliphilum]